MNLPGRLFDPLIESPLWRTFISVITTVAASVLTGTFVYELSTETGLAWSTFYKIKSFYGLIFVTAILYWHSRALYVREKKLERFMDDEYCIAYMRSKCLPEAADRFKALIREGTGGELAQAMDEVRRILQ